MNTSSHPVRSKLNSLLRWVDSEATYREEFLSQRRSEWLRVIPFGLVHLTCLAVFWVGWSPVAVGVALAAYAVRMFAITGFYHRYFSHRSYRTSRIGQFVFALLGATAVQRGPLWWAAHHRHHHRHSDTEHDVHSPRHHGFLYSHVTWIFNPSNWEPDYGTVKDLTRYPELVWLDRHTYLPAILLGFGVWLICSNRRWFGLQPCTLAVFLPAAIFRRR